MYMLSEQIATGCASAFMLVSLQPLVEHEVRSLKHPLYGRPLVNRNPAQTNRPYARGQDSFRGIY